MNPTSMDPTSTTSTTWRKSTRSGNTGGECVEVAAVERDPQGSASI
jgi:hypothetical protein